MDGVDKLGMSVNLKNMEEVCRLENQVGWSYI